MILQLYFVTTDHSDKLEFGYKQFMGEIYGDNILFTDGKYFQLFHITNNRTIPKGLWVFKFKRMKKIKKELASSFYKNYFNLPEINDFKNASLDPFNSLYKSD